MPAAPRQALIPVSYTHLEAEELDAALISYMNHHNALPSYSDSWEILKLKSDIYFFKIFHSGDNFVGCFISAKNIVKPLKQVDLGKDGFVALASPEGHLLTQTDKLKTQQLSFPKGDADSDVPLVSVQGSYLIILSLIHILTTFWEMAENMLSQTAQP